MAAGPAGVRRALLLWSRAPGAAAGGHRGSPDSPAAPSAAGTARRTDFLSGFGFLQPATIWGYFTAVRPATRVDASKRPCRGKTSVEVRFMFRTILQSLALTSLVALVGLVPSAALA